VAALADGDGALACGDGERLPKTTAPSRMM
jgi:hypothetical protein